MFTHFSDERMAKWQSFGYRYNYAKNIFSSVAYLYVLSIVFGKKNPVSLFGLRFNI